MMKSSLIYSKCSLLWIFALVLAALIQTSERSVFAAAPIWNSRTSVNNQVITAPFCPASIGFGETVQCSILTTGETDTYTFTANAGDKILVRASKSSGDMWPGVRIYSPNGIKICDAYGSIMAEIANCNLSDPGTYTILAYEYFDGTGTGDYYLHLQRLNNPGNALAARRNQILPASLHTPAEIDAYTFWANSGEKISVRVSQNAGDLWPGVRVFSPDGMKLCEAYGSIMAEIASCNLPVSGTYLVLVYDGFDGTGTGDYRLSLDCCRIQLPLVQKK